MLMRLQREYLYLACDGRRGYMRSRAARVGGKLQNAMEKPFEKGFHPKLQSAMEYLMTYGWAILIIAVVLSALFQLGVFNASNFAPKAQPGACQVIRPYGPGTTADISVQGLCNGQLPKYVALFNGNYPTEDAYVDLPYAAMGGLTTFTIVMWFDLKSTNDCAVGGTSALYSSDTNGEKLFFTSSQCGPTYAYLYAQIYNGIGDAGAGGVSVSINQWYFVAETVQYNSIAGNTQLGMWLNNNQYCCTTFTGSVVTTTSGSSIGSMWKFDDFMNGSIADVQLYNASLASAEVNALYDEGIGGAPVKPQNLVGWWPLNENANDYSGNNYNGGTVNAMYTGGWTNQYTGPV